MEGSTLQVLYLGGSVPLMYKECKRYNKGTLIRGTQGVSALSHLYLYPYYGVHLGYVVQVQVLEVRLILRVHEVQWRTFVVPLLPFVH